MLLQALLKEGEAGLLPAVIEAYARPTRIVRGKDVSAEWAVDEGRFEMEEERALWAAYQSVRSAVRPAMGIRDFFEVRDCPCTAAHLMELHQIRSRVLLGRVTCAAAYQSMLSAVHLATS